MENNLFIRNVLFVNLTVLCLSNFNVQLCRFFSTENKFKYFYLIGFVQNILYIILYLYTFNNALFLLI